MLILRPVKMADLDQLLELAKLTGFGLTTLPHDRDFLHKRVRDSHHGFDRLLADDHPTHNESYLFVLEDLTTGRVVGTCGVMAKVGGFEPFYAYRIETGTIQSKILGVQKEIRTLHLVMEHNGPCEIGSLFLHPDFRKDGNGRLLSLARFVFMAQHPAYFDPVVLAEMRGVIDDHGHSPFWDALGHHFFDVDFPKADYMSMINKRFIAELMPRHPIYVNLLPPAAQAVIGKVHDQTEGALRILLDEGFKITDMVDIFEAGPVVSCPRDQIRSVRDSAVAPITDLPADLPAAPPCVIGTTGKDIRYTKGPVEKTPQGIRIPAPLALALGVKKGDQIRYVPMKAS